MKNKSKRLNRIKRKHFIEKASLLKSNLVLKKNLISAISSLIFIYLKNLKQHDKDASSKNLLLSLKNQIVLGMVDDGMSKEQAKEIFEDAEFLFRVETNQKYCDYCKENLVSIDKDFPRCEVTCEKCQIILSEFMSEGGE